MSKLIPQFELYKSLRTLDGGEGSGNFGHSGRPGEVGGSGGGGGAQADDTWTRGFMASQGINVSGLMKNYGVRVEVLTKGINRMIEKGEMPFKDQASYEAAKKEVGNLTDETQKKKLQNAINRHDLYQKCQEYMKSNPVGGTSSGEAAKATTPAPKAAPKPKPAPAPKAASQPAQSKQEPSKAEEPKKEPPKQINPSEVTITSEDIKNAAFDAIKNRNSIPKEQLQHTLDILNEWEYRMKELAPYRDKGVDLYIDIDKSSVPQVHKMDYLKDAINKKYNRAREELQDYLSNVGRRTRPATLDDVRQFVSGRYSDLVDGMQDRVFPDVQKELAASYTIARFMYQNMLENARR